MSSAAVCVPKFRILDAVVEAVRQETVAADVQLEIQKLGAEAVDEPRIGEFAPKADIVVACIVAQFDQSSSV